jgi:hypothetical protein
VSLAVTLDRLLADSASSLGAAFRQWDASPKYAEFLYRSDFLFLKAIRDVVGCV